MAESAISHAALMDATYRYQRLIYDATRRYYLLGRDRLIADLSPRPGSHVLEIACGTGRNLLRISQQYPNCALYGLDISEQMLRSAHGKLGNRASLARADACDFDAQALFGRDGFDRIIFSFSLSMIPDWTVALRHAQRHLAAGGEIHIVDFGGQEQLPAWFRAALNGWLAKFHVTPRQDLEEVAGLLAVDCGGSLVSHHLYRDYARYVVLG